MRTLDRTIEQTLTLQGIRLPVFHDSSPLLLVSDYGGQHKSSPYETYTFVIVDAVSYAAWEGDRKRLRSGHKIGRRRLSYKDLGDVVRRDVLPQFLESADMLPGLCCSFSVEKSMGSLMESGRGHAIDPEIAPGIAALPPHVCERLLRVMHFASLLLSGLSQPSQDVIWFSDEDAIAPNDAGVCFALKVMDVVSSHYLSHCMGRLRFGTTKCDPGDLQIEDLVSIADLAAGAIGALLADTRSRGLKLSQDFDIPLSTKTPWKMRRLLNWLALRDQPLKRLSLVMERSPDGRTTLVHGLHIGTS
jgi:hypothetical protein